MARTHGMAEDVRVGSKLDVWRGRATVTAVGLSKGDLALNAAGRIVTKTNTFESRSQTAIAPISRANDDRVRRFLQVKLSRKVILLIVSIVAILQLAFACVGFQTWRQTERSKILLRQTATAGATTWSQSLTLDPQPMTWGENPPFNLRPLPSLAAKESKRHQCSASSWVHSTNSLPVYTRDKDVPTAHFNDSSFAQTLSLPELLTELVDNPNGERRYSIRFLHPPQFCEYSDIRVGGSLLTPHRTEFGILTLFRHALLAGDVVADCNGQVIPAGLNRPDRPAHLQWNRAKFRLPASATEYTSAAGLGGAHASSTHASSARRFSRGFVFSYPRDSNYQMYMAVQLSRWWFFNALMDAGWLGRTGDGSLAIVLSGSAGGSGEIYHPGGGNSSKLFIAETAGLMLADAAENLGVSSLKGVELVLQNGPLFFDELWIPGIVFDNFEQCMMKGASIWTVPMALRRMAREHYRSLIADGRESNERQRWLSQLAGNTRFFLSRQDAAALHLDGENRQLIDSAQLATVLSEFGFQELVMASLNTAEKAYVLGASGPQTAGSTVIVAEHGATVANIVFAPEGSTILILCPPEYDAKCDWFNTWFAGEYLAPLGLHVVVLSGIGVFTRPDDVLETSFTSKGSWRLKDFDKTVNQLLVLAGHAVVQDRPSAAVADKASDKSLGARALTSGEHRTALDVRMEAVPRITGALIFAECADLQTLRTLSYDIKFGDHSLVPMVMETRHGTCNVFSGYFCEQFASGKAANVPIDTPIVSIINAFLTHCREQEPEASCNALDIGANMGTLTSAMLATGATVTAIEPQRDLAQLVWATACVNGWSDRLTMYNNAVTVDAVLPHQEVALGNKEKAGAWGFQPDGSYLDKSMAKTYTSHAVGLEQVVSKLSPLAFVKVDTDALDDPVLRSFLDLIDMGKLTVTTFAVETVSPEVCHAMQSNHGYAMYITVNPHTQFKPLVAWVADGTVKKMHALISGERKFRVTLWKIGVIDLALWRVVLSKDHIRVCNMLMTNQQGVI